MKRRSPASTTQAGFSVFVSNDGTNGVVGGHDRRRPATTASASTGLDVDTTSQRGAAAVATLTTAITTLGSVQGTVGTLENRLQFAISLAQSQIVNNKAAESRIRDANVAEESANLTRFNILKQSGIAALSQANQSSAAVLSLLR